MFWRRELLNPKRPSFRLSDSCVNQVVAITREIFETFCCNPPLEVKPIFLLTSIGFEKVSDKVLSIGISRELYNFLENYPSGTFQRFV